MRHQLAAFGIAAIVLGGCSGGSGSSPISTGTSGTSGQTQAESAISTVNAFGEPVKNVATYTASLAPQSSAQSTLSVRPLSLTNGACTNDREFFRTR